MLQAVLNSKPRTILIAVLLLGLFLRVYCLTCESVWLDEGYSILWAKQEPLEMIDAVSRDVHPPLYFLVLHYWIALFGDAEFTIRFLSVIFGTLAIFMMYKVGSLIFDRNVGLLSSVILALSAFHIYYSQELRAYSLMVLLTLASMYYFIRLLEERKRGIYAGYILSSTLLLYTHYFGIFVVLVQNVFFFSHHLFMKRRVKISPRKWHRLQAILFITFLPCFPFLLRQSIVIQSGAFLGWIPRPSLISVFITFLQYSGYFSYFAENIAGLYFQYSVFFSYFSKTELWIEFFSFLLGPLFIALMLNSIFRHKKFRINVQRENLREKYFLLLWLFIPIVISFIASQFLTSIYYTRFTIPCSLAFYLLVAKGLFNVDKGKLRVVIGGIVIIFSLISIWGIHSNLEHEQWREVAEFIEDNGRDSDLVLISAWYCHIPFDYYFNETGLVSRDVFPKWDMSVDEKNINTLTAAVQGYERVWIVLSHNGDPHGLITKTLGNLLYEPSLKKDLIGIELYLFEKI